MFRRRRSVLLAFCFPGCGLEQELRRESYENTWCIEPAAARAKGERISPGRYGAANGMRLDSRSPGIDNATKENGFETSYNPKSPGGGPDWQSAAIIALLRALPHHIFGSPAAHL